MTQTGSTVFTYGPDGQRLMKGRPETSTGVTIYFRDPWGRLRRVLGWSRNTSNGYEQMVVGTQWDWFLGTPVERGAKRWLGRDRLGSVRAVVARDSNGVWATSARISYYAYGGPNTYTSGSPTWGYGTYEFGEGPGYYAQQRWYDGMGRFGSPDPYEGSGSVGDPGSWNRYGYVGGDPVNFGDPRGTNRLMCDVYDDGGGCAGRRGGNSDLSHMEITYTWNDWSENYDPSISISGGDPASAADPSAGNGGVAEALLQVENLSKAGNGQVLIENTLRWIRSAMDSDPDCANWLTGAQGYIDTLLGQSLVAHGDFKGRSTVAAITGTAGTNVPVGYAAIVVNNQGAFFNSGFTLANGVIQGGTDLARVFIALHELGHGLELKDYESDYYSSAAGARNDAKVLGNCDKTLQRLR